MTTPDRRIALAPDLSVSRIVTGLWQMADQERDGRSFDLGRAAAAMAPYLAAGLTSFDMADHYGSAELVAGRFRTTAPRAPELFTKWVPAPGPPSRDEVRTAVGRALERLATDAIDLFQFHAWNYADPAWLDRLFWLDELRQEGLIRHLGVTNFDTAHLRVALTSGVPIVTNQVCFSLLDRRPAGAMTALCREFGVRLLCYGTVAGGFLTERWLGAPEPDWSALSTWSEMKYGRFIREAGGWHALQRIAHATAAVARRHGVSMANVACRWVLDHPATGAVIVGARLGERDHIADNLRVFDLTLSADDRAELDLALGTLTPIPGDCGDEYRRPPYLTASGDLSHHLESVTPPYRARAAGPDRTFVLTGTPWEPLAGFARAVRHGNRIAVSGTTATHGDRAIGGADPVAQTHFIIDKIEGALASLGASLADVIRTRIYLARTEDWEGVSRAHGERFGAILPANTLVGARLIGDEYLVEMEAEAVAGGPLPPQAG